MGKAKKKEVKKAEKSSLELPEDNNSKISSDSVTPTEEPPPALPKSLPPEEPTKQEEAPVQGPVVEVYEEPVLASLVVERYEGDTVHGLYNGEGVADFKGGNVYRGTFCKGLMHGKGTYTWVDGLIYEGEFHMNFPMGHGIYTWPNGSRYEGQVYEAIRNGKGFFLSSSRHVSYVGEWCKGARHGKGTIYYNAEQTSWYEGDWVKNNKEGWGLQCFKSGNLYEGQWKNNKFHGEGCMKWLSSNEEYMGQWVNGIQNGLGTHTWFMKRVPGSQYSLRNKYVGDFVDGQRQGHGRFYYANGAMYDGEWKNNKKHGMGKFTFKNGKMYVGEFVEDQIAECPNFKYDRVNTPDLSGIHTRSPRGDDIPTTSRSSTGIPSLSGSYAEVDISSLLNKVPEHEQEEELKQVEYAILRNLTQLRKIYNFYSSLGSKNADDNAFVMTKLQFWRFLKDCRFHHYNLTLSEMDRLLVADNVESELVHSPYATMLLRTFLTNVIYLAYHICQREIPKKCNLIADCFSKIMTENILPQARNVKGFLFCDPPKTQHAMCYIDNCWSIYRSYCQANTPTHSEPAMKMRHFIWIMNDLHIIGKELTITHLVDILASDDPSVRNANEINLELELTFLEFFEALLGCAAICVTSDLAESSDTEKHVEEERQNTEIDEITCYATERQLDNLPQVNSLCAPEDKDPNIGDVITEKDQIPSTPSGSTRNIRPETGTDKWFRQISLFFTKIFFPAHEHAEQLKQEIPKIRARQAELARIRQIEEEEEARLKALKEEEESRRIEQLEMDKANAIMEQEQIGKEMRDDEQKSGPRPATPKEEPPVVQPPTSGKTTQGSKKKKK